MESGDLCSPEPDGRHRKKLAKMEPVFHFAITKYGT